MIFDFPDLSNFGFSQKCQNKLIFQLLVFQTILLFVIFVFLGHFYLKLDYRNPSKVLAVADRSFAQVDHLVKYHWTTLWANRQVYCEEDGPQLHCNTNK